MNVMDIFGLAGRVAVITGAAGGVGRSCAEVLAGLGATVVCTDLERPSETVASVEGSAGTAIGLAVDVTSRSAIDQLVQATIRDFGRLDIMVNNAAIYLRGAALDASEADLGRLLATNLNGVVSGCQAAGRAMSAQGSGSIINIASEVIDRVAPGLLAYSATKAAVRQVTRTFAVELGAAGVRVNAIAPGWMDTDMTRNAEGYQGQEATDEVWKQRIRTIAQTHPLGRTATPADVAFAAAYLASPASSFMTGQALRLNGGAVMPW